MFYIRVDSEASWRSEFTRRSTWSTAWRIVGRRVLWAYAWYKSRWWLCGKRPLLHAWLWVRLRFWLFRRGYLNANAISLLRNQCIAPSGTEPCRRQLFDWLHKPRLDRWLVARQYPFRWQPVPISMLVWVRSFIERDDDYHSDLSDQSALEIRVRDLG